MRLGILLFAAGAACAQEPASVHQPKLSESSKQESAESGEKRSDFEAEFAASNVFRSGSYFQPLWRGLAFEGHYFGSQHTDVGHLGAAWIFKFRELKLSPGAGVMFGNHAFATTPMVSFRWDYEKHWFVTQGLLLQGLRKSPGEEAESHEREGSEVEPEAAARPAISDGSHVSARWKRLMIGGTWEHIHFRENEWKGGGRLAFRLLPRVSAVLYVFGPGKAEWRGGILIHPPRTE